MPDDVVLAEGPCALLSCVLAVKPAPLPRRDQNDEAILGKEGVPKKVARFVFNLPAADSMEEAATVMTLVTEFIDAICAFKMSAAGRAKASVRKLK